MSYISQIYIDTTRKNDSSRESNLQRCADEESKGHIAIIIRSNRSLVKFYVSRDVSIQDILTSFHHDSIQLINFNACSLTYNSVTEQFQDAKVLQEYSLPLKNLFQDERIEILMNVQ